MKKQKIIILCGLPCSGKTTFSQCSEYENYVHLSTDSYIERVAKLNNKTYNDVWKSTIKEATRVFYGLMCISATTNSDILIDQTNLTFKKRKFLIDLFYNHQPEIVFFNISLKIIKERNNRLGKHIPEYVIDSMYKTIEIPTPKEAFIRTVE